MYLIETHGDTKPVKLGQYVFTVLCMQRICSNSAEIVSYRCFPNQCAMTASNEGQPVDWINIKMKKDNTISICILHADAYKLTELAPSPHTLI